MHIRETAPVTWRGAVPFRADAAVALQHVIERGSGDAKLQYKLLHHDSMRLQVDLSLANCFSSRNRQLIKPSNVNLPTEFIQLERQLRSASSNFSRRITTNRAMGDVIPISVGIAVGIHHLSPNLAAHHLHNFLTH